MLGIFELSLKYIWPLTPYAFRLKITQVVENFRSKSTYLALKQDYLVFLPKDWHKEDISQDKKRDFENAIIIEEEKTVNNSYSLISTCLNEEESVNVFINSINTQNILPFEVIVTDGGSSDKTLSLLNEWAERQNNVEGSKYKVQIISSPGASIATGRNLSVKKACSENLLFTDFGTKLSNSWSERLLYPLSYKGIKTDDKFTNRFVAGWYLPHIKFKWQEELCYFLLPRFDTLDPGSFFPSGRSFAITKSFYNKISGFPECLTRAGEDSLFCYKVKKNIDTIFFSPDATSTWEVPTKITKTWKTIFSYSQGDGETGFLFWDYYFNLITRSFKILFEIYISVFLFILSSAFSSLILEIFFFLSLVSIIYKLYLTSKEYGVFNNLSKKNDYQKIILRIFMLFFMLSAQILGFIKGYKSGKAGIWKRVREYILNAV